MRLPFPAPFPTRSVVQALAAAGLSLAATGASAQMIEDMDLRPEGSALVLQVRLVSPVQFTRAVSTRSGDLTQAFYDVLPARDLPDLSPGQRRVLRQPGLPDLSVTDESETSGARTLKRKLVLRLDKALPHKVRAGRGGRSIEFVFEGLAGLLVPTAAPATPAAAAIDPALPVAARIEGTRFHVVLARSDQPGVAMDAPVPSSLQDQPVFTARRVVEGRTVYEIQLGQFGSRPEAEQALGQLRARFPKAEIIATVPGAPVTAARPAAPQAAASAVAAAEVPAAVVVAPQPAPMSAAQPAEIEAKGTELLAQARAAFSADPNVAFLALAQLLDLPSNGASRAGQALIGDLRAAVGDRQRARTEYELYLKLYPDGPEAEAVRRKLADLPAAEAPRSARGERRRAPVTPTTTVIGSVAQYYFGGQSKVRTQEFQDSPLSGLPELARDDTLSGTDQKMALTTVDLSWRHRDADNDTRLVFRDNFQANLMPDGRSRNRLTAAYVDWRSLGLGTQIRLGRQNPVGGGVMGRFDGAAGSVSVAPGWRVTGTLGRPTDDLADTHRWFVGTGVEADAIVPHLGGSLYLVEQRLDGETDRRSLGSDLRWADGGTMISGQLDYDIVNRGLNIASSQAMIQWPDNTTLNLLVDRRATPLLALGNTLFFSAPTGGTPDPAAPAVARRLQDVLLITGLSIDQLRENIRTTTGYLTQGVAGLTSPVNERWTVGGDLRLTNIGAIPAAPQVGFGGQAATGNIWSLGSQVIGTNLFSARDTHVIALSLLKGATWQGQLLSYNLVAGAVTPGLSLEPSIRLYHQSDDSGQTTTRWSPGLRSSWRLAGQFSLEAEASAEVGKTTVPASGSTPARVENARRIFYFVGGRYDF